MFQRNNTMDIITEVEVLLDQAKSLIKTARTFFIMKPTEIKLMSRDKLKTYLHSDWTLYEERAHDLMHISYAIRRLGLKLPPNYQQRCTDSVIDLKYYSSLVTSTVSMIIQEGDLRKIKLSEPKIKIINIEDAPKFNGTIFPFHFYEFHSNFLSFLETSHITLSESAPLWIKSLEGLAKTTIERIFPTKFAPEVGDLITNLKNIFGQNSEIIKEILREHRKIGQIPPNSSEDWKTINTTATRHKILLGKLEKLPSLLDGTVDVEELLDTSILPFHHQETYRNQTSLSTSIDQKISKVIEILKEIEQFSGKQYKKKLFGQFCISSNSDDHATTTDDFDCEEILVRQGTDPQDINEPEEQPSNWWDSLDWGWDP